MPISKRNVSGSRLNKNAYIAMLALKKYGYTGDYMITSMQRSSTVNTSEGGVKDSDHIHGNACDFGVKKLNDGSGDNESTAFMKWFNSAEGKKWKDDFNIYYKDETTKKGAPHHHFGFRGIEDKSVVGQLPMYEAIYDSKKNKTGSNLGLVEIGKSNVTSETFDINPFDTAGYIKGDLPQDFIPTEGETTNIPQVVAPSGSLQQTSEENEFVEDFFNNTGTNANTPLVVSSLQDTNLIIPPASADTITTPPASADTITTPPTSTDTILPTSTDTILPASTDTITASNPNQDNQTSTTKSGEGSFGINPTTGEVEMTMTFNNEVTFIDNDMGYKDIVEVEEEDDPDAYSEEVGEAARKFIADNNRTPTMDEIEGVNNGVILPPLPHIDPDNVTIVNNGNTVEEDETNTRKNFENNPTKDIFSTSSIAALFGTYNTEEAVTTGEPQNSAAFQQNLNIETANLPRSQEQIQEKVDEAVVNINKEISEKEKIADSKYIEGETKIVKLEPRYERGVSISIDGMEFHSGGAIDPGGQSGNVEDWTYGKNHSKYVAGTPNYMSLDDINKFEAKLWFVDFDKKKSKYYESLLNDKTLQNVKKEGYTAYVTRQNEKFRNLNTGYVEYKDFTVDSEKYNEGDLSKNQNIDYDVFDYQNYIIKKEVDDAQTGNKAFEEEQASVLSEIEKKMREQVGKRNIGLENELLAKFTRENSINSFDGMSERQISKAFYNMANKEMRGVQEKIAAKYQKDFQNAMNEFIETYSIPNKISESNYTHIDKVLDSIGWGVLGAVKKRDIIDNMWLEARSGFLSYLEPEEVAEYQNEFYAHYYEKIALDSKGNMTPFAIKDFASNALDNMDDKLDREYAIMNDQAPEGFGKGAFDDNRVQKFMGKKQRRGKELEAWEHSLYHAGRHDLNETTTATEEYTEASKNYNNLLKIKKFAEDIMNDPEGFSDDALYNFWQGFSSKRGYEYIPFVASIPEIMDLSTMYRLSQKDSSTYTEREKELMNMYALKQQSRENVKALSPSYRRGNMLAEMIPYVGEFIATSGYYSAARASTKVVLTKSINKYILTKAKYASIKTGGKGTIKRNVGRGIGVTSFLVAAGAQTAANPQQYVKHYIENLTPEMQFMHTIEGDALVDLLDNSLIEEGTEVNIPKLDFENVEFTSSFVPGTEDKKFIAALRAYGIAYAEFSTERMGEMVPMFGKFFRKKILKNPDWLKRASLGYYLHKKGLSGLAAKNHFMKNNVGWNGIVGEVFEEVINQPISSLIMGKPWYEGLATKKEDGSLDFTEGAEFLKDMFTVTGVAQVAFGGINMGHQLVTGKKPPTLSIGYERYDTYAEFKEDLKDHIKNNTLGDQKVKVTGNPIAFFETENALKTADKNSNFDRSEFDKARADRNRRKELEILNKLSSVEREKVLNIDEKIQELESQLEDVENEMDQGTVEKVEKKEKQRYSDDTIGVKTEEFTVTQNDGTTVRYKAKTYLDGTVKFDMFKDNAWVPSALSNIKPGKKITSKEAVEQIYGKNETVKLDKTEGWESLTSEKKWSRLTQEQKERVDPKRAKEVKGETKFSSGSKQQRSQRKQLQTEIQGLNNEKREITFDVAKEIIEAETKKVQKILDKIYKKNPRIIKAIDKKDIRNIAIMDILAGVNKQNKETGVNDVYILEDGKIILNGKIAENENFLQSEELNNLIKEMESSEGFISRSDGNLYINVDVAARNGNVGVAAHELLHSVLAETLQNNPEIAIAMGYALINYINSIDFAMVQSSEMMKRLQSYRNKSESEQAEEALTLFTDAIRSGDIQFNENVFTKIGDLIRRVLNHAGLRKIRFRNGRDVFNFLKDYNSEVVNDRLSAATVQMARKGAKPEGAMLKQANAFNKLIKKADKQGLGYTFSKPVEETSVNKDELFANSNRALDEAMEMSHGIENFSKMEKEDQAVEWNKLSKDDKLIIGYQVGLEWQKYALKHIKLKLSEDAGVRTNEDGVKDYTLRNDLINNLTLGIENENGVPFMVNTWNPMKAKLTTHLYGLIPLRIPAAARQIPGFFSIKVAEEKGDKQSAPETKKKEESKGKDLKLYEYPWVVPFNDKTKYPVTAKQIHLAIVELIKQGKIDITSLNSYKDVRSVIPQEIIDMVFRFFGIVPKPGNLTKTDIKNSQLRIEFNYNFVFGNFPQGYNSENKSTGATQVLMTERPTKKNKLKEPVNVFYEELEVPDIIKDEQGNIVEVKTKAKRPVNLKIQRKIKNPGKEVILSVFGITETKGSTDNLYKKEDNTSSRIRAAVMEHVVLFVNQAVVEVENNPSSLISQALNDGKAPFRYSKGASKAGTIVFEAKRLKFAVNVSKNFDGSIDSIINSLDEIYNDTLVKKDKEKIAKEIFKVIKNYSVILQKHRGVGARKVIVPLKLDDYINHFYEYQNEETAISNFLKKAGLIPKFKTVIVNGEETKVVYNIGSDFLDLNRVIKLRAFFVTYFNGLIKDGMEVDLAVAIAVKYFKGMLQGASTVADGRIVVGENGQLSLIPKKEWEKIVAEQRKKTKSKKHPNGKPPKNRKQFFSNSNDFTKNMLGQITGVDVYSKTGKVLTDAQLKKKYNFKAAFAETSEAGLKDPYGDFNERKIQSVEVREAIEQFFDFAFQKAFDKKGNLDFIDIGMLSTSMGSGMNSIMRKAANLAYISSRAMKVPSGKRGSELEYEHMKPQVEMMLEILGSYVNTGSLDKSLWEGYQVAIISKSMDTVLTSVGLRSRLAMYGDRYYNMLTFGHPDLDYLISLNPKHKGTDKEFRGKDFVEARKLLKLESPLTTVAMQVLGKAYKLSKGVDLKPKGISILDFDDTLATSKSMVKYTTPEGVEGKLNAEQYANTYQDLSDLGYQWDFSEFNEVIGGKTAPLFQKALKLQKKFGSQNMFVLTARPAEAATAIFTFLQANGLNIPLENITGLANSTAEAKALWIADKATKGYNDFYFADDALQNVHAVQNMLDQFDVKSKVQQARRNYKFSLSKKFNDILEDVTGIESKKEFAKVKATKRGKGKGKFRPFVPPGAEDFIGLLYNFMGKGKKGQIHRNFFEKALLELYNEAYLKINTSRERVDSEYKALRKTYPKTVKLLGKKSKVKDFSNGDAVRVYLWASAGMDIPGLSKKDLDKLVNLVENNKQLKVFALALSRITQQDSGYIEPIENWNVGNIASDLHRLNQEVKRSEYLQEWQQNVDEIFSDKNLNKIEAAFGLNFREALEDMLYRMKNGSSRPKGLNKLTNAALNFINKGVGTIMFWNGRSAVLQTISFVNFINMNDNNLFKFGKAYADFPQFIKDFTYLFNSDYLKQRRSGMKQDLNAAEMLEAVNKSNNRVAAMIGYLLEKGFIPTKIADSFAIALGGSAFYRNRVKSLMKSKKLTKKQAEEQAMKDFTRIAEETQQSSRPDFISQQQASLLGHFVLAFANTPMQYTRLQKKAAMDIIKGRISPGYDTLTQSNMANFSSIIYYGFVQNLLFYTLQTAMFATGIIDDDDDNKKKTDEYKSSRRINGMIDTLLRGTGIYGALVSMLKNYILALVAEDEKGFSMTEANPLVEALNLSPPLGSKARLLVKAQRSWKFNKKQFGEVSYMDINHPLWDISAKYIQAATNAPTDRILNKTKNMQEVLDNNNSAWQRFFLFMGWDKWGLYVPDRTREASKGIKKKKRGSTHVNVAK